MSINVAIMKLAQLAEHSMLPKPFVPMIDEIIKELSESEELEEPIGWIPVWDRLPEERGEYLTTYRLILFDKSFSNEVYVGFDSFRGKSEWARKENRRVLAWMPKPEPYVEIDYERD